GGFPVIAFGTPNLYFAGEFTAGERKINVSGNTLKIIKDGNISKFVKRVYKVVYSGNYGIKKRQKVLFVTERAVFRLGREGIELIEIAPEIDIEKDILSKMEFKPRIPSSIEYMSKDLFNEKPLNLRSLVLEALRR
ncbi:MAG: acyl CoA:acetate/3-ketoacid CoA transferase, partial [Zestosphaera sp.]